MTNDNVYAVELGLCFLDTLDEVTTFEDAYRSIGLMGLFTYAESSLQLRVLSTMGSLMCALTAAERNNISLVQVLSDLRTKYLQQAELMMG